MHQPRLREVFILLCLMSSVLACNVTEFLAVGPTATPSMTPTATITPTSTPSPTPIPSARLDSAWWALFKGDWDVAVAEYQISLTNASDPDEQATAQLGIGVAMLKSYRFQDAVEALTVYIESYPVHDLLGQGYFHRAQAQEVLGNYQAAANDYGQYLLQRSGLIDSFVYERQGDALREARNPVDAIVAYQNAMVSPRLGDDLELEIKIGRALVDMGDYNAALVKYTDVFERATSDYTKAQMDYSRGRVHIALGQFEEAYGYYLHAVENYPLSHDTYLGLVELVEAGVLVNELDRGLVDYYAGQHGVAVAAFDRYLNAFPLDHDGTVHYYKGLSLRALGTYADAIDEWDILIDTHPLDRFWDEAWEEKAFTQWAYLDQYNAAAQTLLDFVTTVPDHTRAAEFLYDAARIKERADQLDDAASIWQRLEVEYPNSEWTYRALFLAGVTRYRISDFLGSEDLFLKCVEIAGEPSDLAAAYLWLGKTYMERGDPVSAQTAWQRAVESHTHGYYGIRAGDLLLDREPFQSAGAFNFRFDEEAERFEAEEWLRAHFPIAGPDPLSSLDPVLANDDRIVRGYEFWQLGLYDQAKAEYESLRLDKQNDAEATYRLMHHFLDLGFYQPAIYAAWRILDLADLAEMGINAAPIYFSRIRFGPYFGDLILPEALRHDFDGLIILSVIRQESLFEGFAISYADARGLMQIIPSTGQGLADQLGWPPGYTEFDLYRPVVSVRLGIQYLSTQRETFDGDLYAALAAYNAGPGNALIWKAIAPDDPDLFLEVIRLQQPQNYIRNIYWAFTNYQALYIEP
ncbi:MAG: tetratricopeptide repeat protein [Anaerolineaceae bacterium]|nr:MAG: tetratricopeptide repeat protein [Anaerolineaceae bacterium]